MKTVFSYVGVVLAALVIWAGCEALFTPNSDVGLRNDDYGFITSIDVDANAVRLDALRESIRTNCDVA